MKKLFLVLVFVTANIWAGDYTGVMLSSAVSSGQTATAAWANDIREDIQRKIWISTEAPSSPFTGQVYFSTTTGYGIYQWYDGSAWHNAGGYKVSATTISAINSNGLYLRSDGLTKGIYIDDFGDVNLYGDGNIIGNGYLLIRGTALDTSNKEQIVFCKKDGAIKGQIMVTQEPADDYMVIQPRDGDYLCLNAGTNLASSDSPANADFVITPNSNIAILKGVGNDYGLEIGTYTRVYENFVCDKTATSARVHTSTVAARNSNGLYLLDDGGNGIFVEDGGNVGIGTVLPATKLDVNGNIRGGLLKSYHIVYDNLIFATGTESSNGIVSIYDASGNADIKLNTGGDTYFNGGNVGIGDDTPSYDLDVSGDIHCTGKLTSDGGNDPPYVLYNYETRQSIIERVKREVTPNKLNGAVMFFNGEANRMELYLPSKGEFRDLQGNLLASVSPMMKTFETKTKYYFDRKTGEVKAIQVPVKSRKFKIKEGYELNPEDGQFYEVIKSTAGEIVKKKKVSKSKAVE